MHSLFKINILRDPQRFLYVLLILPDTIKMSMNSPKISFCITCMNRLEHLKQTLPINISHALFDSKYIEFVLLDYNSTDGLETWIKEEFLQNYNNQVLRYFRTTQPLYYHRSHSRNMIFRLASGDILVNLDADNFIGKGFVNFILKTITPLSFFAVDETLNGKYFKDALGRICVWREDFETIRGYDERMAGYGFEDLDLKSRLKQIGLRLKPIKNSRFLKSIQHDNGLRIENEGISKNLYCVAVKHSEPFETIIYVFYKDNSYEKATIVDNIFRANCSEKIEVINELYQMVSEEYVSGKWTQNQDFIYLENQILSENDESLDWFYPSDFKIVQEIIYSFSAIKNKKIYFENIENKGSEINQIGFGGGKVIRNFKETIVL